MQTDFRLNAMTMARVKTAAKLNKVSINTYKNCVLKEATWDIESEDILAACKSHNSVWEVPVL